MENNKVNVRGLITKFELNHEINGEKFYKTTIKTFRNSGVIDEIPVLISEKLINQAFEDSFVEINGEFRSHNKVIEDKRRLILSIFVKEISQLRIEDYQNEIALNAFIVKEPVLRATPLGRTVCDLLVAVNRKNHKSDYIPCITWGKLAKITGDLKVGDNINILGRIQSREYTKNNETRIAYEVSINELYKAPEEIEL